jgi:hypothetical protein
MELVFGYPDPVLRYKFINKYKKYYNKTEIYNLGTPIYKLPEDVFLEIIKYLNKEEKGILFQSSDNFHIYGSYLKTNSPWIGAKMYYSYSTDGNKENIECFEYDGDMECELMRCSKVTIVNIDKENLDINFSAEDYEKDIPIEGANVIERKESLSKSRRFNFSDIEDEPFVFIDYKYTHPNELCSDFDIFPEVRNYIYKKIKSGRVRHRYLDEIHDELIPFITKKNMCEFNNLHEFSNKFSEPGTIGVKVFRNVLSFMTDSDRLDILLSDDTKSGMLRQLCFAMGVHDTIIHCIEDGYRDVITIDVIVTRGSPNDVICLNKTEAEYVSDELCNKYVKVWSDDFIPSRLAYD